MVRISAGAALATVFSVALLAASCGGGRGPGAAPPGFPLTVERLDGEELTLERPPERIISLSPGHTEILFAIGVGDQIIGVDTQSDFPEGTDGKPKIDAVTPDLDEIVGLDSDLVVVMSGPEEFVRSMDERGLKVLWLALPDSEATILEQIDQFGEIMDRVEQSDELVDAIDAGYLAVFDKVGDMAGPRVYHEMDSEYTTVSSVTFTGELYDILFSENIAGQSPERYPQLTLDDIVEADPEVIILAHSGESPESVKARPGWEEISAVKNDRVFVVDPALVNRPGPRLVDGLETLAGLLHPDLFPES